MPAGADLTGVRALMVLSYYVPYSSGLTIYAQRLAEELACRGAAVTVLTTAHAAGLPRRETIAGVRVRRARALARIDKGVVAPGLLLDAVRLGRRADVVLPVLPLAEAGPLAMLVSRKRLLPLYVCDLRLGPGRLSRVVERLSAWSARVAVRRARRHGVLSLDYARASRVVGRYADRALEVTPPVDQERFAPAPSGDLRARLGVCAGPVVGFVGRLVFEKGLPVLVRAMRLLRERHLDATLIVAGEGAAVAGGGVLDELAREVADDPGVVLTGFLPDEDLPALYSMCDALALPSIDPLEAFGMVQVEAMLCGCPVVASDLPGVRLPVVRTGMGVLVPPGDPERLAEALAELIATPDRFRIPREDVARAFDPQVAFDALAGAVAEAAGR